MTSLLSRRHFLATHAAALLGVASHGAFAAPSAPISDAAPVRSLALDNIHTGEKLSVAYWIEGRYIPDALLAINRILRDFRTGEAHIIDPRLLDLLSNLHKKMESGASFEVISGYRSPKTNAKLHSASSGVAVRSLHMSGTAIDLRLPGRALKNLHSAALELRGGGVGYYPVSNFVHVDVGNIRRWNGA